MKTLKAYIILFIATIAVAKAQFTKAELQVSGLTCSLCANTTEKSLKALPFISEIKPDLVRNVYYITFKDNTPINFELISNKVKKSGFSVSYLKTTYNFDNTQLADNSFIYGADTYKLLNSDKPLKGPVSLTIVDQGFAPKSVTKKHLGKEPVLTTTATGRIYHVTAI